MRTRIHGNDTLPSLPLTGVVIDRQRFRRLHDPAIPDKIGERRPSCSAHPCCGLPDYRSDSWLSCCKTEAFPPFSATGARTFPRRIPAPGSCTFPWLAAAPACTPVLPGSSFPLPASRLEAARSGGSTINEVRFPVGRTDWNTALYAPETSRSVPGSVRESRRKSPALSRSSSALSSSVKNSLPANCAGRWSGVW